LRTGRCRSICHLVGRARARSWSVTLDELVSDSAMISVLDIGAVVVGKLNPAPIPAPIPATILVPIPALSAAPTPDPPPAMGSDTVSDP
jgi:hypothetical protein